MVNSRINKAKTAIDLYSGIGGWTLGLELAGINVSASYELWEPAIQTHKANFSSSVFKKNIRNLDITILPKNVDFVVGSPPCTNFSYSNKGGSGDIDDGLKDLSAFLKVIEHLNPTYWAMENVPRVKGILDELLVSDPHFKQYAYLFNYNEVIKCPDYGIPQNRKRMIAGKFPYEVLEQLKGTFREISMGEIADSLNNNVTEDLIYGLKLDRHEVTGLAIENYLTDEELRMNRESKTYHPVYNKMSFPDRMSSPSRTITSTCTRVSRESIIIKNEIGYRRLSLRERALMQGFPISFKFLGKSYSDQLKMIGNAIPPPLTYLIASCMLDLKANEIPKINKLNYKIPSHSSCHIEYNPNTKNKRYPANRTFKFCIPNLRFGSGVRFQLSNKDKNNKLEWRTEFYFGNSKKIFKIFLENQHTRITKSIYKIKKNPKIDCIQKEISKFAKTLNLESLQSVWNHSKKGISPFNVVDFLGKKAEDMSKAFDLYERTFLEDILLSEIYSGPASSNQLNIKKIKEFSTLFLSGLVVCSVFNASLTKDF